MEKRHYNNVDDDILAALKTICGIDFVITDRTMMEDYIRDEALKVEAKSAYPDVLVKPASTEEVSKIMKLANEKKIPVTPVGGKTGLTGGTIPIYGGIQLSLERMNNTLEIDTENLMVEVHAGVRMETLYDAIEEADLALPIHPTTEDSQVGGTTVNNAGGEVSLKHGVMRDYVKGLEVVLPNGEVVTLGGKLYKDNVGYSLKDLIVGSEGTLGIVTKVILRLKPASQKPRYVLVPFKSRKDAIEAIPAILQKAGFIPLGCDYLEKHALALGEENIGETWPAEKGAASLMIAIAGGSENEILEKAQKIMEICEANGAIDTFLAIEDRDIEKVTKVRLGVGQAPLELEGSTMFFQSDMVVPPAKVPEYLNKIEDIIAESPIAIEKIFFGHAADGNLHAELAWPLDAPRAEVSKVKHKMMQLAIDMGGSLSGEHGIGLVKRKAFRKYYQPAVLRLNDAIKHVFDPNHILNPGKLVGEVTEEEAQYLEM